MKFTGCHTYVATNKCTPTPSTHLPLIPITLHSSLTVSHPTTILPVPETELLVGTTLHCLKRTACAYVSLSSTYDKIKYKFCPVLSGGTT